MLTKYISKIINFRNISNDKYENCETREQAELKQENNNYFQFENVENELFAGDKIIGIFKLPNEQIRMCLYEWKQNNNPKQIIAYSLFIESQKDNESHVNFKINDDVILLMPKK